MPLIEGWSVRVRGYFAKAPVSQSLGSEESRMSRAFRVSWGGMKEIVLSRRKGLEYAES